MLIKTIKSSLESPYKKLAYLTFYMFFLSSTYNKINIFYCGFITTLLFSSALISVSALEFFFASPPFGVILGKLGRGIAMMLYKIFLFTCVVITTRGLEAQQFLYPVASYTDKHGSTKLYLIYQKSLTHLELWLWDPQTKFAVKALLSSFTPAGLTMLPDNAGFSFIDDGRIRVKKYSKRLPKAFDIREPLYEIGIIRWIDEYCGYFSAKERGHYGIYQLTLHDDLDRIHFEPDADCMYPCKCGKSLFYIERRSSNSAQHYTVWTIDYPVIEHLQESSFNTSLDCKDRISDILREETFSGTPSSCALSETKKLIGDFGNHPIAFLTMISEHEGYVIEHPATIDKQDKTITFTCHWLQKKKEFFDEWEHRILFQFSVPSFLLISNNDSCLYESLLPLLPRYYDGLLYFVNALDNNSLALFRYNLISADIQKVSIGSNSLVFSPVLWKKQFFYGGALSVDELSCEPESPFLNTKLMPTMSIYDDGNVVIQLPSFST